MPADIQARIARKEEAPSPQRKKVKSAPIVVDDDGFETPAPTGVRSSEKVRAEKGKGKEKEKPAEKAAEKPLQPGEVRWTFVAPPGVNPPARTGVA